MDLWKTSPCRGQNKVDFYTTLKTKFGNLMRTYLHRDIFHSFSRPTAQGKPQLKVKGKDTQNFEIIQMSITSCISV